MPKVWGNIGAWAAEAERAEAEEKEQAATAAAAPPQSYPSLKEAVSTNKGKKKTKMTLQEFTMAGPGGLGGGGGGSSRELAFERKGLTPEEMMRLPTGPKERSPEEMQYGRLGGGFSSYGGGGGRGGGPRMRDRDGGGDGGDGSWGSGGRRSYGGFADDRRGGPQSPRVSEYDQPSRADEVDNWAVTKKPISPSYNRYGGGGGGIGGTGGGGGFSKADEIDNWAASKKPMPMMPATRSSSFSPGFRDSGGSELDRWQRGVVPPREGDPERPSERRRLVLDPRRSENSPVDQALAKTNAVNKPSPFGAARPREEVLAEKGLDWKKVDLEIDSKKSSSSGPGSAHTNSRPGSAHSGSSVEGLEKTTRPKVNPFGDAKPREVLLQEKGIDYRKIDQDLEHRRLGRSETEAEKNLKEEIDNLKQDFEKESGSDTNKESLETGSEKQTSLRDQIVEKERELEQLTLDLDNKARFSQKPVESPGSGAGRSERSPSQSGSVDDLRSVDLPETPRSRGTRDPWIRTGDEKRGFGGGRDRGFSGNRDLARTKSKERW